MYDDPVVAEVRRLRDEYASRFNFNLEAIVRQLQAEQSQGKRPLVKRKPKRPERSIPHSQPDVD